MELLRIRFQSGKDMASDQPVFKARAVGYMLFDLFELGRRHFKEKLAFFLSGEL